MSNRVINSFDQVIKGEFKRTATDFHNRLVAGTQYPPEAGRYCLYVSLACPWAHRCLITRALKGLEDAVKIAIVHPVWGVVDPATGRESWVFGSEKTGTVVDGFNVTDPFFGKHSLREIYELHDSSYEGRYTVPALFDLKEKKIVNNESTEILQILCKDLNDFAKHPDFTLWPENISLDTINKEQDYMYPKFNNGVYRAGFAQAQEAYEDGVTDVFEYLTYVEELLGKQRFIAGSEFSEADVRFFVTAIRFDPVYNIHFKCSKRRISDYPNVYGYIRDIWQNVFNDEARKTFSEVHIKQHYYRSHPKVNPFGIVPQTTPLNLDAPVARSSM